MAHPTLKNYDWFISIIPKIEKKLLPDADPKSRILLPFHGSHWLPASLGNAPKLLWGFTQSGYRKKRLVAAAKSLRGEGIKLQTSGNAIRVGRLNKGLRIFYPNFTLKVRKTDGSTSTTPVSTTWWQREKLGREDIHQKLGDYVSTPEVIACGEEAGVAYLLEERVVFDAINPQKSRDRQRMKDQFIPLLMKWYEPVEWQPLSTAFKTQQKLLFHQALTSPAMAEIKPAQVDTFRQLVDHFSNDDVDVPFSLCHGDMCINNAGITPTGELIILDWETWGNHPIVEEFARFIMSFKIGSEIHKAIRQLYAQRFEQPLEAFDFHLLLYYLLVFSQRIIGFSEIQAPQNRYRRLQVLPFLDAATEMGQLLKLI